MLEQPLEQLKNIQKRAEEISGQVDILSKAQKAGMTITPKTSVEEAQSFISSQPTINVENNINPPKPPEPTDLTNYTQSIQKELEKQRLELEKQYQTQLETIQKQLEESRKLQEQTIQKQESTIQQAEPLTQPFRQDIEEKERERLKVEENYFANQSLVNELDSLLTEINTSNLRDQELIRTGVISRTTANKRKENATARVGVIEAVLNARNNQIGTALNFIDRTVNAITQDKQSRLSYLNTLISFYDQARNEQGQKIVQLEKDERDIINKQISLLENDLAQAQKNADYIKELMISPETAQMVADAGITLLDTPEVVNKKLADYSYRQEKIQIANEMEQQGFQFITAEIANTKPADEVVIVEDSRGVKQYWWKKKEVKTTKTTTTKIISPITGAEYNSRLNQEINNLYSGRYGTEGAREVVINMLKREFPNQDVAGDVYSRVPDNWNMAGVQPIDFTDEEFRQAAIDNKSQNKTYEQTIAEIENNPFIKNKDRAKLIASEVYGKTEEQKPYSTFPISIGTKKKNENKTVETMKSTENVSSVGNVKSGIEQYFGDIGKQILDFNKNFLGQ